jgi:beta-galactosidase
MKNYLIITLISLLSLTVSAQKELYLFSYFINNGQDGLHLAYSNDGLNWQVMNDGKSYLAPQIGKDKLMRDPCVYQGTDSTFHMMWTSGWWDKGIGYASSKDLITWSEQKNIPVMEKEPEAKNSWAPEMYYDLKQQEYFIFWATTIPGRHSPIAYSEREKDLNHRIYYVTTKDFNTFGETKMFFNPSFSAIDATIIKKDTTFYMILKNENPNPPEKNLRVTKSTQAEGPYPVEVSSPITGNYWAEGPSALQVGDYVYVYFDKYRNHKYGAVRSRDMVTWEDVSDQVTFPAGVRHGTAFKVNQKIFDKLVNYKTNY